MPRENGSEQLARRSPKVGLPRFFPTLGGAVSFLDRLAQQSLDVGEVVDEVGVGEDVLNFDIGHEQPTLISFQSLDLKAKVVGHCFNSSPRGQMQPLPYSWLGHGRSEIKRNGSVCSAESVLLLKGRF
jgi:hypothetical protein